MYINRKVSENDLAREPSERSKKEHWEFEVEAIESQRTGSRVT